MKINVIYVCSFTVIQLLILLPVGQLCAQDYKVGVYYFPSYHADVRNENMHGKGWDEWDLMKHATPRFDGHYQPKIPLWGYEDEANPKVMERKIDVAERYGVDFFIFDWYYYEDAEFLNRALDEGYFGAENNSEVPFCLMWANHHWRDFFPMKISHAPIEWDKQDQATDIVFSGYVAGEAFDVMTDLIIEKYFNHPAYYKINGAPYFSIFQIEDFIDGFSSEENAIKAIEVFRLKTIAAGFPDLHFNIVGRGFKVDNYSKVLERHKRLLDKMGGRSINMYNMVATKRGKMENWPQLPYDVVLNGADKFWNTIYGQFDVPYFPTISLGWDVSPRTVQSDRYEYKGYPFDFIWVNNTPELFEHGLRMMKAHMDKHGQKTCIINAWNEWTEGCYLEPDIRNGYKYLEAVRKVFTAE